MTAEGKTSPSGPEAELRSREVFSRLTAEGETHDRFRIVARTGMGAGVGRNKANEVLKLKKAINRQRKESAGPGCWKSFRELSSF